MTTAITRVRLFMHPEIFHVTKMSLKTLSHARTHNMKKWVLSVEFFDHVEQAVYTSREEALATAEAIIGDYEHGMRKIIVLSLDGTIAKLRLFKVTDGINSRSPASV